ncbi:hypothetical protein ASF53_21760 [Methylobacterium sp. Leaf123]|nr:hypothetical protein ASF53_21760 [Methylobacterium sp. Leaf123]
MKPDIAEAGYAPLVGHVDGGDVAEPCRRRGGRGAGVGDDGDAAARTRHHAQTCPGQDPGERFAHRQAALNGDGPASRSDLGREGDHDAALPRDGDQSAREVSGGHVEVDRRIEAGLYRADACHQRDDDRKTGHAR